MKKQTILIAISAILFAACNIKSDSVQSSIPGTYINSAKGEYSQAEDTLLITQVKDNAYRITRNTTYQAIRDGKLLPKHHQVRKLNGLYDPQKQVLFETTNGRVFTFDPGRHLLRVNQAVYHKLN